VVIKSDRCDKTEIEKFFLTISGHQQRWLRPLPGAILIPPALLVAADSLIRINNYFDRLPAIDNQLKTFGNIL
jgi:hypothetical protein